MTGKLTPGASCEHRAAVKAQSLLIPFCSPVMRGKAMNREALRTKIPPFCLTLNKESPSASADDDGLLDSRAPIK
jgi:hypothetical protein